MTTIGKRMVLIGLSLILILALTACGGEANIENGAASLASQKINAEEAMTMIKDGDVTILDVRTQEEFDEGHIQDAVLLPNDQIMSHAEAVLTDKEATILVYCRSGNRSAQASQDLVELGYSHVYDFGGIKDWPYEVVR